MLNINWFEMNEKSLLLSIYRQLQYNFGCHDVTNVTQWATMIWNVLGCEFSTRILDYKQSKENIVCYIKYNNNYCEILICCEISNNLKPRHQTYISSFSGPTQGKVKCGVSSLDSHYWVTCSHYDGSSQLGANRLLSTVQSFWWTFPHYDIILSKIW